MNRFLIIVGVLLAILGGAFLLLRQPEIPRAALEAKYATAPSQFVTINYPSTKYVDTADNPQPWDTRVHVRDVGPRDAPAIVLIHGSNASLFTWEPWVQRLSGKFRVVTIDLPGHGLTGAVPSDDYSQGGMAVFVRKVTDKLGLKRFALAGNSMGGGVAARFAEIYSARVTHLILVDAGGLPRKEGANPPLAFRLARLPVIGDALSMLLPRSIVEEGLKKAFYRQEAVTPAMVDQYWDFARMAGTRHATKLRFALPMDSFVQAHTGRILMPTLILWGRHDNLIPVAVADDWHRAVPGSKLIVYEDAGHIPMEDVPDRSAADVAEFVALTPPTPITPPVRD